MRQFFKYVWIGAKDVLMAIGIAITLFALIFTAVHFLPLLPKLVGRIIVIFLAIILFIWVCYMEGKNKK